MIKVETKRMILCPMSNEEMKEKIDAESDDGMKQAYSEMLTGCMEHPEQRIWYAIWVMQKNSEEETILGDFSFKGLHNGTVEIGYGIREEYEGQGYMTEAVSAIAKWASVQDGVQRVEAETDSDNLPSRRVLEKAGFEETGIMGEEGPRFLWKKI